LKLLSLFANIGVAEAYLAKIGVPVVLANELIPRRAQLYSKIYPETEMICGDITDQGVLDQIISRAQSLGVDAIMATPPCQGISRAGKQILNDERNLLFMPVLDIIDAIQPNYVFMENVPQFLEAEVIVGNETKRIIDVINDRLADAYEITTNLIDTKNYSVPQTRQRAILLMTKKDRGLVVWTVPAHDEKLVSLEEAIGHLPSLDPFVKDITDEERQDMFPDYQAKVNEAQTVSPWHKPPVHIKRQVITMMHTPTGKTAFDNEKYKPTKADGSLVTGYKSTYRRLRWCDPASTVTMDNRKISSQNNVHPGRFLGNDSNGDVLYSDARALTLFELMRVMSLPDWWPLPLDTDEAFVRSIIGEGIPPLFVKKVFENIKQ